MLANRISFVFDLQGPSFKLDTACSSSFIALEQAVGAIRAGKCDAAIVAASIIYTSPEDIECLVKMGALSPEGQCQTFDAKGKNSNFTVKIKPSKIFLMPFQPTVMCGVRQLSQW